MSETGEPVVHKPGTQHLTHALWAAFWMYGGRAGGMVWTLALVGQLGIADYGKYAMAYAVYSLIGSPIDNLFVVRSVRESEEHFLSDRATRYLLGVGFMAVGLALLEVNYVAAFGLFVSGGELTLKAWESRTLRDGHPHKAAQIDTGRQFASVVPACIYLFAVPHPPTLQIATSILVAPYVLTALWVGPIALRHRPGIPGSPRLIAILVGETFAIMAGVQGDLLLLGWLTNSTTAGYYGICTTVTLAIVAVGQTFGMSYNQALRDGDGHVSAGPPLKATVLLGGVAAGLLVLLTGLVMMVVPAGAGGAGGRDDHHVPVLRDAHDQHGVPGGALQPASGRHPADRQFQYCPDQAGLGRPAGGGAGAVGAAIAAVVTDACCWPSMFACCTGNRWHDPR